ncbi:MAG TPA: hypothetical protein VNY06_00640 [Methylocella sp.]|nr:hypothetical protein [Methylocella sp.]
MNKTAREDGAIAQGEGRKRVPLFEPARRMSSGSLAEAFSRRLDARDAI